MTLGKGERIEVRRVRGGFVVTEGLSSLAGADDTTVATTVDEVLSLLTLLLPALKEPVKQ